MIEVEVHRQLHAFLRDQGSDQWPHHLTIARLVARAFRLKRSALIQISAAAKHQGLYRLSYLAPLMIWREAVILVAPLAVQQQLLQAEMPHLHDWMQINKPILASNGWPGSHFKGVLLVTPEVWLQDYLTQSYQFPTDIPTLVDDADQIETWARQQLTLSLSPPDWEQLIWCYPPLLALIRETRVKLTRALFQHPENPYGHTLIEQKERQILAQLHQAILAHGISLSPPPWQQFWQAYRSSHHLLWSSLNRENGAFSLHCAPNEVNRALKGLWSRQPVVLIGNSFDLESGAKLFRQQLGLEEMTYVQFAANRDAEAIQLYLPDGLPMPNTPSFQGALLQQLHLLMVAKAQLGGPTVIIIEDTPMQRQIATAMASEFGSRVQVETPDLNAETILISGWGYWLRYQATLPIPKVLVVATLPIPSLEDPRVAGRVAYYKQHRQDWFRLYLLPTALRTLQTAIAPIRCNQGIVALFDNRVLHRSYGQQVLTALSPYSRINYLDDRLFATTSTSGQQRL
ncbi:helicase C-terminal domain-containing protein [Acaryochloris sp. IP29b_bin.137]|uniref:helicase C-terminal domain-containing protein n=1 Tax=Acaryochloris sp. IP29b_bin.137 TaxID=2969217 RepID=UPI002621C868|nr:helicase C-terminal domain-containing protein [Acaryochloris sp. IP29b_bin.137]